jgi:predicted outer membrane protein
MDRRQFAMGLLFATAPMAITRTAVAQPAPAGAIPAREYLAMASRGGMLLEETARSAFDKTQNPRVKRFSRAEVVEQVNLTDRLSAASGMAAAGVPMAAGAPPGGLVGGLVEAPFVATGAVVGAAGSVLGVAPAAMTSDAQKAHIVAQIQSMPGGPEFDATFVQVQLTGHQEAYAIHSSYAQSGDDPALRRVARSALPLLRLHIAQLTRMQASMGGAQG